MHIHFIAIGGSAMHNLAIALHLKGYKVTGSDDEIFEPSRSRLEKHGLLPQKEGWYPEEITSAIDVIILGMHARTDNPELRQAQEMGLKIYSYPEYLYEQTKDKIRVVIGGSHGKTTTTSMIMHVLKFHNMAFDYMVGANIEGFDTMVGLSHNSPIAIFEGDEYLSSPIDLRPKFHHYRPNIALLTGIAWDHINVFPTFDGYVEQFSLFARMIEPGGTLIYFEQDEHLQKIAGEQSNRIKIQPYTILPHRTENGKTCLLTINGEYLLNIFGEHNLQNLAGARMVCHELEITDEQFHEAISTFKGSARRLERIAENDESVVFYDFAHSPSKLKATTAAVKAQFPERKLIAIMELHTFSSLKKEFLPQYNGSMGTADVALVYFNPQTIEHKRLEPITAEQVAQSFATNNIKVYTNSDHLFDDLLNMNRENTNVLIMTSGNFSGKDIKQFGNTLLNN
jgi:UDP-N-acetylmuramate: L-alanyl-gamma-D-glutamyl-meso-diaminopimelate ligase